ncbi:MAG TPA: ABC transporter permease [Dyella sp.]|nr:ABC transporter permease [Dyella sp.]
MVRYYFSLAIGGLQRTPWLALLMVLTLAIGLSTCMITIALRHALAMDPVPGKSLRLLNLQDPSVPYEAGARFSYGEAGQLTRMGAPDAVSSESGMGTVTSISVAGQRVAMDGGLGIRYATAGFFAMFDISLERGRVWTRDEEQSAAPVALISEDLAAELFPHASPLGHQVGVGDTQYTVIGVLRPWNPQPHYIDLTLGAFGTGGAGIYLPVKTIRYAPDDMLVFQRCPRSHPSLALPADLLSSACGWLSVWYLVPFEQDVSRLTHAVESQLPEVFPATPASKLHLLNVRQIVADVVPASVNLYALLGVIFLVLCVVNASGMQLSRLMRGTAQIGIRRALGASRLDIVKQYLCDALLVGGAGGMAGMMLTFVGMYFVRQLPLGEVRYAQMAYMDGTMFALMVLLVFVCSALAGVVPAWMASRADPALVIKAAQ